MCWFYFFQLTSKCLEGDRGRVGPGEAARRSLGSSPLTTSQLPSSFTLSRAGNESCVACVILICWYLLRPTTSKFTLQSRMSESLKCAAAGRRM